MVDLPLGFKVVQPQASGGTGGSLPAMPAGFRVVQPAAAPTQDPYFADLPVPGTIEKPPVEWSAPGAIVPIQWSSEGESRLAVPQIVTETINGILAPGKALSGGYDELEVNSGTGEVSPFDPAMITDAASLAGLVAPASPGAALGRTIGKAAAQAVPEIADLYVVRDAAYKAVDQSGVKYSADDFDALTSDMLARAADDSISIDRHPKAFSLLSDLENSPRDLSLTQLDQLRQVIRRDLVQRGDAAEAHFGRSFIDAIDDFIETRAPSKTAGTSADQASILIRRARKAHSTVKKAETIEDAIEAARLRAAASGSGGNVDNSIRQALASIVNSEKKSLGFTDNELDAMRLVIQGGGTGHNALRKIGKLSPSGNGLMAALGLGAAVANPSTAIIPGIGLAAKTFSDGATERGVQSLNKLVRTGVPMQGNALGSAVLPINTTSQMLIEKALPGEIPPAAAPYARLQT